MKPSLEPRASDLVLADLEGRIQKLEEKHEQRMQSAARSTALPLQQH